MNNPKVDMGRVRTRFVKRMAEKIITTHGTKLGTEFDTNKQKVQEFTDVSTKKLRNMIAGYITRKMKTAED